MHLVAKLSQCFYEFWINMNNNKCIFSSLSVYTTQAQKTIGKTGHCLLLHDGFRFGPVANKPHVWRCTSNKNRKRCTAQLRSKVIDGIEMIKSTTCIHNHERPPDMWALCQLSYKKLWKDNFDFNGRKINAKWKYYFGLLVFISWLFSLFQARTLPFIPF